MRRATSKQEQREDRTGDTIWRPPSDFVPAQPWPKQPPGPPPIESPVKHSGALRASRTSASAGGTGGGTAGQLTNLGEEGATRGMTPSLLLIKYAADKQQGELSLLLKEGQNPNVKIKVPWQDFETTPLFEGAVNGYKRIVRLLIEHGAKLDTVVGRNWTPLYNAALNGHDECVRLLVDAGADVTLCSEDGFSPLFVAAQGGFADSVTDILASPTMTPEAANYAPAELNGATALYVACQNGHVKCVLALLEAGVDVDPVMQSCGSTPLHISMFLSDRDNDAPHIKICEMLFAAGASLDKKNNAGQAVQDLAGRDYSLVEMCKNERERRVGGTQWWE